MADIDEQNEDYFDKSDSITQSDDQDLPKVPMSVEMQSNLQFPLETQTHTPIDIRPPVEKTGIVRSYIDEYKNMSFLSEEAQGAYDIAKKSTFTSEKPFSYLKYDIGAHPLYDAKPPGWNIKQEVDKLVNIPEEYNPYLQQATGPMDLQFRLDHVNRENNRSVELQNGSTVGKVLGGISALGSEGALAPFAAGAKYAKLGAAFVKTLFKQLPYTVGYSTALSAADNLDKINGNMEDFLTETAINSLAGGILGGAAAAGMNLIEKSALWEMRGPLKSAVDGIDFKHVVDEKGELVGIRAVDTTGSLSAAKVSRAQEYANSMFSRQGIFKVPYVGEFIKQALTIPGIGTPLPRLLTSRFGTMRVLADRVFDHSIITQGMKEGEAAPKKYTTLMGMDYAKLRFIKTQLDSLHAELNGFKIRPRIIMQLQDLGRGLKNTVLPNLIRDTTNSPNFSKDQFNDMVIQALRTGAPSDHSPINDAVSLIKAHRDPLWDKYKAVKGYNDNYLKKESWENYYSHVFDTPFMQTHEDDWIAALVKGYRDQDQIINDRMAPIKDLEQRIESKTKEHEAFIERPNITTPEVTKNVNEIKAMKARKKALEDQLTNDLRNNPAYEKLVDDWTMLSQEEVDKINRYTKRVDDLKKRVDIHQEKVDEIKKQIQQRKSASLKKKKVKSAKSNKYKADVGELLLEEPQHMLDETKREYEEELQKLQELMHTGKIEKHFFNQKPGSFIYEFKDISKRLKFRDVFESDHDRAVSAKNTYNKIMHQTPEQINNELMGRFGASKENHAKARSLMIDEDILYDNHFMSNDLMANISNYTIQLSKAIHLNTILKDITHESNLNELGELLSGEYENMRADLYEKKIPLKQKLIDPDLSEEEKNAINKSILKIDKQIVKLKKEFSVNNRSMSQIVSMITGEQKYSPELQKFSRTVMSYLAYTMLGWLPVTMLTDFMAIPLKHGLGAFIKSGVYPIINNISTMFKGKDGEALRKTAPSLHLGLQDILNKHAEKNWSMYTSPYINGGKIVDGMERLAHMANNFSGVNWIDNFLQHVTGSVSQSEIMRILDESLHGKLSEKDSEYILKYGLNPKIWAKKMVEAWKKKGGGKTNVGGYLSNFWDWEDKEASNEFGHAVYRAVKDTHFQTQLGDSPFWTNNPLGALLFGFQGWTFGSINRYVIPTLQRPDAQQLTGILLMLSAGALVSPIRRLLKNQDAIPEGMTPAQFVYEAASNCGWMSYGMTGLNDLNLLFHNELLKDFRTDKYYDRTRAGLLGPAWGTANNIVDILDTARTNTWNHNDVKKAVRLTGITNSMWTSNMSNYLLDGLANYLGLPETRADAKAAKEAE